MRTPVGVRRHTPVQATRSDILGTQQSGVVDFKKLDLTADAKIIKASKAAVDHLLKQDPHLQKPENADLRNYYLKLYKGKNKWSRIS